jgi:uncharacterized protein
MLGLNALSNFFLPPLTSNQVAFWPWVQIVLLAPIVEELFFRGLLFGVLALNESPRATILFSSLLFMLAHHPYYNSAATLLLIFLMGIVLGVLRKQTGSLWPCIALHSINNFLAVFWV